MAVKRTKKPTVVEKTYLLTCFGSKLRRVTVPSTWKLTFGATVPGNPRQMGGNRQWSLRFYEGNKENLRAVFSDVIAFREEGIKIQERVTKVKQKRAQKQSQGGAKDIWVEARITEWVDPDQDITGEEDSFLALEDHRDF